MAIKEERIFRKYPYSGTFYTWDVPMDVPLDEREPKEIVVEVLEHCDIQRQGARHNGGFLGAGYSIYYPLTLNPEWDGVDSSEQYMPIKVRRGMEFRGGYPLLPTSGTVEFIRFSQLGQCVVDIFVKEESEY